MGKILRKNCILIFILAAALLVRVVGLVPGYGPYHPDEGIFYSSAIRMVINGDFNPGRFDYPAGVSLIYYFIFSQFILPVVLFKVILSNPKLLLDLLESGRQFFDDYQVLIFGNRGIDALFWSRHITAILGAISVFVTYLVGSKLFDKKTGLFAAFFLAFDYRHVYSSHFALSDVPNSLFAILAFLGCLLVLKKNSLRNYLLAGLFLGISFSMKYQIFPAFTLIAIHLYLAFKEKKIAAIFDKKIFLSFLVMVLVSAVMNIHIFFNLKTALYWTTLVSSRYGAGLNKFNFYPLYYLFYFGIGPLPFVAIILGILAGLIFFPLRAILLLTYILPFFFVLLYYMSGGTYVRNFTTVMPFLVIFAGLFFSRILDFLTKILRKKTLALIIVLFLAIIVNLEPIKNSLVLSTSFLKPWNRPLLQTWGERKLPKDAKIANDNLGIDYDERGFIQPWNVNEENSTAELQERGFDFAIANIDWRQSLLYWWFGIPSSELIKHRELPYLLFDNSYNGIAMLEFLQYSVFEVYKPWQAPELNYFVSKIPPLLTDPGLEIGSFEFDKNDEGWYSTDIYNNTGIKGFSWDKNLGNEKKGSLVFKEGLNTSRMTRYTSLLIPIKPGKVYTVSGFLKTEDELLKARERDGFLRMDFYKNNDPEKIGMGGINKSVSGRAYGTTDWVKKQTTMRAPDKANFLTVSLQKDSYGGRAWLDDVKIYELDKMPENFPEVPFIKSTIPKKVLYPNSIL